MTARTTPTQHRLLTYIREFTAEAGRAPTYRQMAEAMGSTPGSVHAIVGRLVKAGALKRHPDRPYGLILADEPRHVPTDVADRLQPYCRATGASLDDALRRAVSSFLGGAA